MRALYTAATGMSAQQTRLDTVANNLANVSTTGYKKSRDAFEDLFYQEIAGAKQGEGAARLEIGGGVRLAAVERDFTQGSLRQTGDPLHLAVQGDAWFVVEDRNGQRLFTRDGTFRRDADGTMVTAGGLKLAGDISIPEDAERIEITSEGTVRVQLAGDPDYTVLGEIELAAFVNPGGLAGQGNNLFAETPESGEALQVEPGVQAQLIQGWLEGSNVDVAAELIEMIEAQRAYELNSKVIQASDEVLGIAANLRR